MDLNLQIKPKTDDGLVATYECPCGCKPRLAYVKNGAHGVDGCCCGNQFAVGPDAATWLLPDDGFRQEVQVFQAPWGEPLQAVWTIGDSTHSEDSPHDPSHHLTDEQLDRQLAHSSSSAQHGHGSGPAGHEHHAHAAVIDPVCGMTVDPDTARAKGLHLVHEGHDYYFCGKGCRLEFGDDPARFLGPSHSPSM